MRTKAALLMLGALTACAQGDTQGPNPRRGAVEISRFACGSCHAIPGVQGADGRVGPPLAQFGKRGMIAGAIPNTPANLQRYLKHPEIVGAWNVMPNQGLNDRQGADIAAYLEQLD